MSLSLTWLADNLAAMLKFRALPNIPLERPEQSSRLLQLPNELLECVFNDYRFQPNDLQNIRMTCSELNNLVKHRVLHSVALATSPEQLEEMASGGNGFCEFAQTLYIKQLTPDHESPVSDPALHKAQTKFLCRAIKTLINVKTVHWKMVYPLKLRTDILRAIQHLPSLEEIDIDYGSHHVHRNGSKMALRLSSGYSSGFFNLKSITLKHPYAGCSNQPSANAVSADISRLLLSCPSLERFDLTANYCQSSTFQVDLSDLVKDLPDRSETRRLMALRLLHVRLSPSPISLRYLKSLQSLDVRNLETSFDERIWGALAAQGIHLKVLSIASVTTSVLGYLLQYRGLEEFHLNGGWGGSPNTAERQRLLRSAIPHHRETLTSFRVQLRDAWLREDIARVWSLDEVQIDCLRGLPRLKNLEVTFMHDSAGRGIFLPINAVLNAFLSFSETLRTIHLNHFWTKSNPIASDGVVTHESEQMTFITPSTIEESLYYLLNDIHTCDLLDVADRRNWQQLELIVMTRRCPIVFDESGSSTGLRRYHFSIGSWEGLAALSVRPLVLRGLFSDD